MDFLPFFVLFSLMMPETTAYSIEKHILDSAKSAEMFDLFHVMPDGMIKVVHELDMMLSLDQYKQLYMDNDGKHHSKHKRKAANDTTTRWPNCIVYYEVSESLGTLFDRKIIKEAIDEWEKYSCLRFIDDDSKTDRVKFEDGDMCLSDVGMQGGIQTIQLASGCRTKGIIVHEIGHAIGWFHEHMRPDRDDYVNIHFNVIPDKYKMSFKKYNTDIINTYGIEYSYLSIMHYGDMFNGGIVSRDPRFQDKIGQRTGLSFKDIKLANVMYNCAIVMGCGFRDCGEGFQLYKSFKGVPRCRCWCDSGDLEDPLVLCSKRKITPSPPPATLAPVTLKPEMECMDVWGGCDELKDKCMSKMVLMKNNCAKTCGFCDKGKDLCMDHEAGCGLMAGYCDDPGLKSTMSDICKVSCDKCHTTTDPCEIYKEMMGLSDSRAIGFSRSDRNDASFNAIVISGFAFIFVPISHSISWV